MLILLGLPRHVINTENKKSRTTINYQAKKVGNLILLARPSSSLIISIVKYLIQSKISDVPWFPCINVPSLMHINTAISNSSKPIPISIFLWGKLVMLLELLYKPICIGIAHLISDLINLVVCLFKHLRSFLHSLVINVLRNG